MTRIERCRSCGASELELILDLGRTPLANALPAEDDLSAEEPTYPLRLVWCSACTLLQIDETVPPAELFRDYLYFSSFSETMVRHAEELATSLVTARGLCGDDLVVEIASNDGYLLQFYKRAGVRVLGIEPARNVAAVAKRERGIDTLAEFFDVGLARRLATEHRASVVHGHNVLAHVADLNGFVAGIAALLADDGIAVLEFPYVEDMLANVEFDTIYHEHLCYFSLAAITRLF
jgi:SAM-dependent methyltransferase